MSGAYDDFRGLPTPALGAAEIALNRYIGADARAIERCGVLAGHALTVCFSDLGLALTFAAETHGMQLRGLPETEPDVRLTGRSSAFARILFSGGREGIAGGGLRIEGDIGIAQQFADLFSGVDFNIGDIIDARFGPVPSYFAERGLRAAAGLFSRLRAELPSQAAEYLREETYDAIGSFEHDRFADEVARVRDDVARLAARVRRLEPR